MSEKETKESISQAKPTLEELEKCCKSLQRTINEMQELIDSLATSNRLLNNELKLVKQKLDYYM